MKGKKVNSTKTITNFVDLATGQIIDTKEDIKETVIWVGDKERFVLMYLSFLNTIDNFDAVSLKILVWCALNSEMGSNRVNLTQPNCNRIASKHNLTYNTIKNAISKLKKHGALIREGSGTYIVNPTYFWRGTLREKGFVSKFVLTLNHIEQDIPNGSEFNNIKEQL